MKLPAQHFPALLAGALGLMIAGCEDRGQGGSGRDEGQGAVPTAEQQQAGAAQPSAEQQASGTVASVSQTELVVRPEAQGTSEVRLQVDESTQVFIDGRQASAEQLQEGAQVRASYQAAAGETGSGKAIRIDATSQPGYGGSGEQGPDLNQPEADTEQQPKPQY